MSEALTAAQLKELKDLLLSRRKELQAEMDQNLANLAPAELSGSVSQDESARLKNQTREVDSVLTTLDAQELSRIDRALEAMEAGDYGLCDECGCNIPFAIMGILLIVLFAEEATRANDKVFRFMWLAITLSFAFYLPVVLFAEKIPMIGMLMIPKTLAYVWVVVMGLNLYRQTKKAESAG